MEIKALMGWIVVGILFIGVSDAGAIALGQIDDFEDGTSMGWVHGGSSPAQPTNISNGGPEGAGDNYLQIQSFGGGGPGSRLVAFNQSQWSGNYLAEGVTRIEAQMANLGSTALSMRVAVEGGAGGSRYGSVTAVPLPAGGEWTPVSFELSSSSMSLLSGTETLDDVLSNLATLRILSNASAPAWRGEAIAATLGVDNILAVPEPTSLLLITTGLAGLIGLKKRKK